ncbi:MAG: hypothetical protein SF097_25200 [Acidobacteriota bacterium]|nr:hypothetical protein [Acidobacteriota bacterium]
MFEQNRFNRFIIAVALVLFSVTSALAQDQDTERRFWPPNYRPQAAKPAAKPAISPGYKRTSPALPKNAIPTAAERNSVVGITIWRLKPYEDVASNKQDAARILVVRKGKKSDLAAERVEASTAFATGQMLRLSIEVPRSGYLYIIDREQYADGSVSAPYLVFPLNPALDDNKVAAGRVIEIPGGEEPFFEVQPLKQDNPKLQTAELLTVLISPSPLTNLPKATRDDEGNYQPIELPQSEVEKWERLWGAQVEQLELEGGAGQTYTRSEQAAGTDKKKRLTADDPPPQTLFRVAAKPGKPLMVKLPLKIAK